MSFNFPALGTVVRWRIYLFIFFSPGEANRLGAGEAGGPRCSSALQTGDIILFPSECASIHLPSTPGAVAEREVKAPVLPAVA